MVGNLTTARGEKKDAHSMALAGLAIGTFWLWRPAMYRSPGLGADVRCSAVVRHCEFVSKCTHVKTLTKRGSLPPSFLSPRSDLCCDRSLPPASFLPQPHSSFPRAVGGRLTHPRRWHSLSSQLSIQCRLAQASSKKIVKGLDGGSAQYSIHLPPARLVHEAARVRYAGCPKGHSNGRPTGLTTPRSPPRGQRSPPMLFCRGGSPASCFCSPFFLLFPLYSPCLSLAPSVTPAKANTEHCRNKKTAGGFQHE